MHHSKYTDEAGKILIVIGTTLTTMVSTGYTAHVLWGWFIVPGFGASPISIPLAIGLMMIFKLMRLGTVVRSALQETREEDVDAAVFAGYMLCANIIVLGMGYLIHLSI